MPAELHDRTVQILGDLPPFLADSYDIQGALDAMVREVVRIEEATATVRDNFVPQTANDYLHLFEALLKLPVDPSDKTLEQRRNSVLAFMQNISASGSGLSWEDGMVRLLGGGWTYAEHDPSDPSSPDPNVIRISLPFDADTPQANEARRLARKITPAHIDLVYDYGGGFIVGYSGLGQDAM